MSDSRGYRRRQQAKLARLEIVSQLYKRQHTVRQIRSKVMKRLNLSTYSLSTVQKDIATCLSEMKEHRLDNMEYAMLLELERIDDACRELWEQYQRSKNTRKGKTKEKKGVPIYNEETEEETNEVNTTEVKQRERDVLGLGDYRYIAEIREQLKERRKILGLYAPEKNEVSGGVSFANMLMQSGIIEHTP